MSELLTNRKPKAPEEFQEQAKKLGLERWIVRRCSMCDYPLAFIFSPDYARVDFDSGCDCTRMGYVMQNSSWDAVAENYNIQNHPTVIERFNQAWQFENP